MGLVTSTKQIEALLRRGVTTVRVDLAATSCRHRATPLPGPVSPPPAPSPAARQRRGASSNPPPLSGGPRAAGQVHPATSGGEPIDITPLAAVAEEMVDTMFTHGDAMLWSGPDRAKDAYLMEHSMNVAILLANFGRYLGLERSVLRELTLGAAARRGQDHDAGRGAQQTGQADRRGVRCHAPARGAQPRHPDRHRRHHPTMLEVATNHHERLDGTGYPRRLKENSCPYRMRRHRRRLRRGHGGQGLQTGMQPTQAFSHPAQGADHHFDRVLVTKFIKCMGFIRSAPWCSYPTSGWPS